MEVPYIRVLGFNERGRDVLKAAKENGAITIATKATQISGISDEAAHVFDLESRATDLYNLCTPRILPCGTEWSDELVLV